MLVSIIIPTINRTEKLKKLLNNIKDQNNNKIEVIIIDQSDKKNTSEFIKDKLINYIWVPGIRNLSDARNYGIEYAKGDYIGFLDDDLTLSDHFINRLFQTIKKRVFLLSLVLKMKPTITHIIFFYLKKFFTEEFSMIEESYIRDLNIRIY